MNWNPGTLFAVYDARRGFAYLDLGIIAFNKMPKVSGMADTVEKAMQIRARLIEKQKLKIAELEAEQFDPSQWQDTYVEEQRKMFEEEKAEHLKTLRAINFTNLLILKINISYVS